MLHLIQLEKKIKKIIMLKLVQEWGLMAISLYNISNNRDNNFQSSNLQERDEIFLSLCNILRQEHFLLPFIDFSCYNFLYFILYSNFIFLF